MGDTNELMEFLSASLGATLDEIYQRLIDCDFTREDPGLAMFVVALLNALGREGRGNRPTEVVLMLALGESGTAERGRNRLMRWRRGEMSGHDLAREPGLGEQRDHRLGEMPLPVQPAQPLIGAKRQRDGPGPSHSVDSPTAAPPLKRVRVSEIEIQTSETIETLEKKERDQSELCAKLQEYRAIARERDEWKKKFEDLQVAYKEDEIKHLKELYMAKVSQASPEILASMRSWEGSNDTRPRTTAQELCASRGPEVLDLRASRGPEAPQQTRPSASSQRFTIPDPSDTYLAPQFQESFNQVARAAMDEINRGTERTLARIVPSQRRDHSSNSSERATRTIACSAPGGVFEKSRVVDIRKNLMARHQFTQVPAEHPRACLNDMSWNPATNDQVIPPGSRHLIIGDSLVRDLNEIFVYGQTTILSFGGASVAQVIKMMEFQSEDHLDTLVVMLGTNDVSRAPVTPENKWEPLLVCLLNELKEKYRPKLVILCTIPPNPLVGTIAADFMNGNVTRWNEMTRSLVRNNPGELRLLDLENMLRMTDHIALTKDGVHFNTQRGRHWINDVFQTQLREVEQESRATGSLARTNLTGGSRIRATVPESLANRLGPLATETVGAVTVAPSSNVRDRLGTAPPPRPQSIGSRLGRSVEQNNRNNSQTASRRNDSPATTNPASTAGPSTSTVPAEGIESGSRLLWNRSDPSHWGQYKTDMSAKLNMNTLTCREDAMRMTGGESPTVSRLYRIPGVDWLLAEQEKFSSSTSLRHADLDGLPHDNTFAPLNTRSLTDVRDRTRERTPPVRKGKFQTENKPNNKHHKIYRQFAKPPGQTPGEYSRDYPRTTTVVGDDKRYGNLKAPIGDGLFAAYDPLDMKAAKYLVVAGSDYLYTPRSLFWPDVIFLTAPKLDWGQAIGMMISVRRVVSMEPQVIVVAGSNDHLQSRGLLSRLTDGSIPSNEVIGEAIMTLLSAMAEVEAAARQRFTMNVVKVIFVLSPGYAALPEPLQFVYTMVTTIAEGIFNVIIPAPNRVVDPDNYYPSRSELLAVWADISNAIQGLRDCSTTRLVLDEVLGLELSNFARLLKLRPGVDDDHLLVQQVADDLWFRQMDHAENEQGRMIRKNMTSAEEDLMAMALRTKPHNNIWLYLSPRLCTLGEDAFEHAPAIIKEIHVYLKNLLNARELAGGKMLKLMQDVNTMSLDKFQADVLATKAQYERSDAILGGMGVGWTPSFLSTCYPKASRNLIASFVKDIRKLSIGLVLALYVTFGHENFVKGPANLFNQALADLRLDGLLTLIAMTYGRLGDLLVLLRYPEQLQGPSREFNAQLETASLKKMKDWRTLLLQYLLQQNRSVTGEDKVATNAGECKQYCGMPLLTDLAVMMRIDPLALVHGLREFVTVVYGPVMSFAFPDVQVKAYRNSVLYVNLVSVVDCSVLNWVEQSELRKLASDDRLFGRIAEPGWVLMDFNNHFKCRMGREDLSHIQFNPKLWNLRPVVKDTGEAVGVPQLPGAYAHAKENQQTWLPGSRPLPDQCHRFPPIRRMLLGVTSPIIAPRIGAARDAEKRMLKWSGGMEPRFISWNVAAAHTFDFSFPDAWSRKKIKALPSRRPEVSAETWNEVYSSADDISRLKWSGEAKVVMLEVARESRGGSYITIEDLAPYGEELVEFLVDDELFYHAGDMAVPARPDSGTDARQGPSGPKPKPDADDDELMDQDDNDDGTGSKTEKPGETDLGALERDLLEYRFSEDDDGEIDGSLLLMAPSSFMSPTKEASADLSPMDPISQARECRSRDPQKLLYESPRRRKIEESMKISFLSTLPEEEWERYQMELEGKTGEIWSRVNFMEKSWDGPLKTSLVVMWELMKPSWCPHPNAGLIWDMTADVMLERDDDASLHDLAMIHHLLAMRLTKRKSNPSTELSEEGTSSNWLKQGTCLAQHSGMEGHVCNMGHCLITLSEQHRQLARLYGRLSMSDKSAMELVADCHGVTDVNLITALGFCSMTSSIESLERLERAHELVTSLSVEIFPGALQTEQKIGGWREALENEMNLKDSEAYHRPTGSKHMVGSSSAPYCNSKYPTHMVVMDARTQQVLVDQLFSVTKCVRLARMSERSYDLLAKIFRAVPKRSEGELQDVVGEEFMRLNEGNVSEFQKQKASGALPTEFPTIEEKDDLHRILMEVEPLLGASGYRTRRNIVRTHGEYPCHCLAQTLWYPKRWNLILVWDVEELYSTGLPDQNQQVSIVVVSAMLAVRWLEANANTSEQETAVPTPEQLSNVKMSRELDLFRTTCKVLRIPKAIERIWSRQRLMPWFRAVMTSWMYERAKRHMSRNTEAYQSFQLDIGPGAYKRAFLTHRNAVTTAVKRVAGAPCVTEDEKKEVLRADLERNVSLCLHNSFCRNREQKVNVDLLPCCKPRLLEQEGWGTARNSLDMLEKVLEDSDAEHQDGEMMEGR